MRIHAVALTAFISMALAACAAPAPVATPTPDAATPAPQPVTPSPQPATPEPATPAPVTPAPATPGPTPVASEEVTVSVFDFGFEPAGLNIGTGTSVTWTNDGELPHTVTFDRGPDSGSMSAGATFEHTFDAAGTFSYVCSFHPTMTGTINVSD